MVGRVALLAIRFYCKLCDVMFYGVKRSCRFMRWRRTLVIAGLLMFRKWELILWRLVSLPAILILR